MLPALIAAGASIIGGLISESGKNKEIALQKEMAEEGVRMRVADARAAGVHPALALGANVPSYTPVGLGSGLAEGLAGAGQDISRAVDATRTLPEKADAMGRTATMLQLENMGLQNDLLRAQIIGLTRPSVPPFPIAGDYAIPGQPASAHIGSARPGMGQLGENEFSEIGGEVMGLGNLIETLANVRSGNYLPKDAKPETHAEYLARMKRQPMY